MVGNTAKLTLAAVLLSASIVMFRLEFARAKPHLAQPVECDVTPPARAVVDNDAPGKGTADPAKTIAEGKVLFAQIEAYRTSHQGRYPIVPESAKAQNSFNQVTTRPDGTALGGPKPHGTRDVLAYSARYYQLNSHHVKGGGGTIDPAGFLIVVWDNGAVDELPYADLRFVKQPGSKKYGWAFQGQAGVPADAVTFDEYYRNYARGNAP